jgi:hypothetical protein
MKETIKRDVEPATHPLTIEELIWSQLEGKSKALERYDHILWKIRAGYLAVLYSLLTVLSGKDSRVQDVFGNAAKTDILFVTAISFSLCALLIDLGFLLSKLRVVEVRDNLSDLAITLAFANTDKPSESARSHHGNLRKLLHLSGENLTLPSRQLLCYGTWPALLLYTTTPITIAIFRAYNAKP